MKVTVLQEFRDQDDFSKVYKPGDVVIFPTVRARELGKRKLVEFLESSGEDPNDPYKPAEAKKAKNNKSVI